MTFIRITAAQAAALRGNYGDFHALDPIPLPDTTDYILTDAVLSHPAFAAVKDTIRALPTYPVWQRDVIYPIDAVVESGNRLWRDIKEHTSLNGRTPPVEPTLWKTAHEVSER